ncbi:hypothetical protein KC19_1G055300, partial [Ceratodon purpureus]
WWSSEDRRSSAGCAGARFGFEKKCAAAKNEVDKIEREASRAAGAAVDAEDKTTEHAEYVRIKNILDVKNNPVYSSAFEEWNRQLKEQRIKLVDKEKEETDVTTQVYNIVGFFSVFQGVVLTAVSQLASGSQPKCGKAWFPIVLSVFATVVALVALYKKYVALKGLEDSSIEFRDLRDEFSKRVETLLTKGKNFKFCKDLKEPGPSKLEHNFWLFKICTLVALLLFTGIFVLSYLVILCDRFLT